jgi:prevent-host-death family protein
VYTPLVEQIGVRELRAGLASVLRQAGAGQRVVVTVDGRPVAQLGPLEPTGAPTLDELAAAGLLEPPRRARPEAPAGLDTAVDVRLDRIVDEVRGG